MWELECERNRFLASSLSDNTRRTYSTGVRQYHRFCAEVGAEPFPLRQRLLELFSVSLARRVGHQTIKVYLSGVQLDGILRGGTALMRDMHGLKYLIRGIKRAQGSAHCRLPRVPVSTDTLRAVLAGIKRVYSGWDALMLEAAVLLAFFGMLRASEYTAPGMRRWAPGQTLCPGDVVVNWQTSVIVVGLKVSKTDPFRCGATVRVGATGTDVCPFTAISRYLTIRGPNGGPLFAFEDGTFLTRSHVAETLHRFAPFQDINTHSLRQGGATALAHMGVPPYVIQSLGRWSSDAYRRYIGLSDEFLLWLQRGMARGVRR